MKQTLLEICQDISSSLSSDEFDSINDTAESLQIANCVKQSYYNMIAKYNLTEHNQLFQLYGSNDPLSPVLMYVPQGVNRIEWIKYFNSNPNNTSGGDTSDFEHDLNTDIIETGDEDIEVAPGYQTVQIISVEDFLHMVNQMDTSNDEVGTLTVNINQFATDDTGAFTFNYTNNVQPRFCCIINDYYVLFDSYDNTQDSSLQRSKTEVFGWVTPFWEATDTFIPNLDDNMFPMLFNEAKSLAFFELKQQPHPKAELEIKRQRGSLQKFKNIAERPRAFDAFPNFGRRGGGTGR
jgi:hypothetical protein